MTDAIFVNDKHFKDTKQDIFFLNLVFIKQMLFIFILEEKQFIISYHMYIYFNQVLKQVYLYILDVYAKPYFVLIKHYFV